MELKSLVLALGVLTPLAVLSSQQTGSNVAQQLLEARARRQQGKNGNNPMTIDRMNAQRQEQEQKSQNPFSAQEIPNNNNANNNQDELERMREELATANANQRTMLEMIATIQRQNLQMQQQYLQDRQADSRLQQDLHNQIAAQRLQQQKKSTVATQQISSNNNNTGTQVRLNQTMQQPARPVVQQNNNNTEQTVDEIVNDAVTQANGFIDDIGSNVLSTGFSLLGVAHDAAQSAHQTARNLSEQADQLINGFDNLIDTEVRPIINGVGRLALRGVEVNRELNPGRNDRRNVNNSASKTAPKKTDRFKNIR